MKWYQNVEKEVGEIYEQDEIRDTTCCGCLTFKMGMVLVFLWGVFWMWCWYMTSLFMFNGGIYNDFNSVAITQDPTVTVVSTILSAFCPILFAAYFLKDNKCTRLGLIIGSSMLNIIAVIFVVGGVYIMILDILLMIYVTKVTWDHFKKSGTESKLTRIESRPRQKCCCCCSADLGLNASVILSLVIIFAGSASSPRPYILHHLCPCLW